MFLYRRIVSLALLLAAFAAPLCAYTIYLRDGSRIIAREKYRVEEGRAIIVLQNGTQTFLDASEIDVPRTEEANGGDYGTALVLEDGRLTEVPTQAAPEREKSLSDLAAGADAGLKARPPATRTRPGADTAQPGSRGDVPDLFAAGRTSHGDLELVAEIQQIFRAQGIETVQVYQGTRNRRTLLEITTDSEASVFRGLQVAANALRHVRERYPGAVEGLEIVMATSARDRAGQFLLTPELAEQLAAEGVDVAAFYIQHVQF